MNYYDEIAEGYDELHREEQVKKLKIIAKYVKVNEDTRLLDVGCGSGLATRFWNCRRTGIDPAVKLVEKAKMKDDKGTYIVGRAEVLPFTDKSFDIVISITAIHNFDEYKRGLSEMKRVGGDTFVISVLKRSPLAAEIGKAIQSMFPVKEIVEEEKDMIYLIGI